MQQKLLCIVLIFFISNSPLFTQAEIVWSKVIGGSESDIPVAIYPVENSYICEGNSNSDDGTFLGFEGQPPFQTAGQLEDGLITGQTSGFELEEMTIHDAAIQDNEVISIFSGMSPNNSWHYLRFKTFSYTTNFSTQFTFIQSGIFDPITPHSIHFGRPGEYWVTGFKGNDLNLMKITLEDGFVWEKSFGGSLGESPTGLIALPNGDIILAGSSDSDDGNVGLNNGGRDTWLLKLNNDGFPLWSKVYGSEKEEIFSDFQQTADGGFILLVGETNSENGIPFVQTKLIKTDQEGNEEWNKVLDFEAYNYVHPRKVIPLENGEYIVASSTVVDQQFEVLIFQLDQTGNVKWTKSFGGPSNDVVIDFEQIDNQEFLVAAMIEGDGGDVPEYYGIFDTWMFKIALDEVITNVEEVSTAALEISPNPIQAGQTLAITLPEVVQSPTTLSLINAVGQTVYATPLQKHNGNLLNIQLPFHLHTGLYWLNVTNDGGSTTKTLSIIQQ